MTKADLLTLLKVGSLLIILVSWLPHVLEGYWFIEIFSHFKVQYTLFLTIAFLVFCTQRIFSLLLLSIIATLIFNCSYIAPLIFKTTEAFSVKNKISIASINLLVSNEDTAAVLKNIAETNSDILVLLEVSPKWAANLAVLNKQYPFKYIETRHDNFGIALYSKLPLNSRTHYFGQSSTPSIISNITIAQDSLTIIAMHPEPPLGFLQLKSRDTQFTEIANQRGDFYENLVVVGDLNCSSFSPSFNYLTNRTDLRDTRLGFGILPTWHSGFFPMQTTLDHCLVSRDILVLDRSVGSTVGSDHLPITAVLGF